MDHIACSRCVLDTRDEPSLHFTADGVCNYCLRYETLAASELHVSEKEFGQLTNEIKQAGKGKRYDCILGVSGGVDSTYMAYLASKAGLRPLVVHLDNGWNSELAVKNIESIVQKLDFDLYTHVINWDEFRDLQLAFLRASVVDIEMLTDHAIGAIVYRLAKKHDIKHVLSGYNVATEGVLPKSWIWHKSDLLNILDIHKKFGKKKLGTFPMMSFYRRLYYTHVVGIKSVPLLNYISYTKKEAKDMIISQLGWRDYGGKHCESIFTRFYQSFILPVKFGIDKRKAHFSSLICSGQMTRNEALSELQKPIDDPARIKDDKEYVIKKLGLTEKEFDDIMKLPARQHSEFRSYMDKHEKRLLTFFRLVRPVSRLLKKRGAR